MLPYHASTVQRTRQQTLDSCRRDPAQASVTTAIPAAAATIGERWARPCGITSKCTMPQDWECGRTMCATMQVAEPSTRPLQNHLPVATHLTTADGTEMPQYLHNIEIALGVSHRSLPCGEKCTKAYEHA